MEETLRGFKNYEDYLSYAQVCLSWMNEAEHRKLYDELLKQNNIDPICVMRRMSAAAHA